MVEEGSDDKVDSMSYKVKRGRTILLMYRYVEVEAIYLPFHILRK